MSDSPVDQRDQLVTEKTTKQSYEIHHLKNHGEMRTDTATEETEKRI